MPKSNEMASPGIQAFRWLGSDDPYLDTPSTITCREIVIGRYGGATVAGADRNEDACLVWCAPDGAWEFAALLDAHGSAESAELVLSTLETEAESLTTCLSQPVETAFTALQAHLLSLWRSPEFRERCRQVRGETACLIAARKDRFLWWLSVGDCALYLFHPDLARLGQFALNQRGYFEWLGRANSFDLAVPCYASGVRELRAGQNRIAMATDGLLECGSCRFADVRSLYDLFADPAAGIECSVRAALEQVHQDGGRDSATVIAWGCENGRAGLVPSS